MASSTLEIPLWRTTDTDPDAVDAAAAALTAHLDDQIDWEITVVREGTVDLPGAPYETYREHLDAFLDAAAVESGTVNVRLYDYSVGDVALDALDDLGDVLGGAELTSCALVNAGLRPLPIDLLFENFVIHEVLHAMVDDTNAPVAGNDHSFGTVTDGNASPMLTGYTEPYAVNQTPPRACDLDDVPAATGHTTDLSRCAREEVNRYLRDDFGQGTDGE